MERAPRNRTLTCEADELARLAGQLRRLDAPATVDVIAGAVLHQDMREAAPHLPRGFADLIVLDPPYNLTKDYAGSLFRARGADAYCAWFEAVLDAALPALSPRGTVYVCADWRTSMLVGPILDRRLCVRNRITWEREKGRGARTNWKNTTEDIWFCTASDDYTFNVDAVKLKRRVNAPYRRADGSPKDWEEGEDGDHRLTHPSNIWTDLTVPFWSMPENTDHPTQKPEKLIAKLVLASTQPGDMVLDPFLGSGTTAVVAQKLGRRFVGIEQEERYCCWARKRLELAALHPEIQGYADGVFWERNSGPAAGRRLAAK
jgi:site-specific DNA-methyltransferase (adenine-specific)